MSTSTSSKRGRRLIQHYEIEIESNDNEEMIWCDALPDDVVLEILSRLPPKAFFRFKCVSKTWLALSSPAFRLNKLLHPTQPLGFFHGTGSGTTLSIFNGPFGFTNISGGFNYDVDGTLAALPHHDEYAIVDCCNGLLLVKCWNLRQQSTFPSYYDTYVYNPATRKHIPVELLPAVREICYESISLAVDPQDQSRFHVVCFRHFHDWRGCTNVFLTFSSASGRWQQGRNLECDLQIPKSTQGTFLDGTLHRVTDGHAIVSVDPINNSYFVTKFDFPGFTKDGISEVGQSHGLLHFMFVNEFRRMSI